MKMKAIIWVLLSIGAAYVTAAAAATYACTGTIDWVAVSPTGAVTVSSQSSGLAVFSICSLNQTEYGVTPAACNGLLATVLVAKETGSQVSWEFNDSLTCNRSNYDGGNWYWLNDGTSVWYYGPQIQ